MKLNNVYWIYMMECVPSGKRYYGQTGKPNPCWRWSDLFIECRNGNSKMPGLQAEWNVYPDFTKWRFQAVDKVDGRRSANAREAEFILACPDDKRLNCLSTSCISQIRREKIMLMLKCGSKYTEITKETGISGGMISRIAKANGLQRRFGV